MHLSRLLLPAAAFLVLSSCHQVGSLGVQINPSLRAYIPIDTTLLAGVDVTRLLAATFYKRHANQIDNVSLNRLTEKIGIDPRRDLSSILFALKDGNPLILTLGRFHAANVETHLQSLDAKPSKLRGQTIFETGGNSVFFPSDHIAVAGGPASIRAVIEGKTGAMAASLLNRLRSVPSADQIWIVGNKGLPLEGTSLSPDMKSALSNVAAYVSSFQAGIEFDAGAHIHVDLQCDSTDSARQVHDALRGGIGLARLTTRDGELALLKLYDTIRITYEHETVHVQADLSPDLADTAVDLLNGSKRHPV